jgi:hypothetical protein
MTFVRGIGKIVADSSCEWCNRGNHEFCQYLQDLEDLNRGASDHRDYMVYPVTIKTCWCYRSSPLKHLDEEDWEGDVDVQ